MPQTLVNVLVKALEQFPVAVIVGFIAWYAYRQMRRTHEENRAREMDRVTEAERRTEAAHQALVAEKDRQIERLEGAVLKQLRAVERRLDALAKRLDDGESK